MSSTLLVLFAATSGFAQRVDGASASFVSTETQRYDTMPKLRLKGSGFDRMSAEVDLLELTFDPPLKQGETYKASIKSDDVISLELMPGKKWATFEESDEVPQSLKLTAASFKETKLLDEPVEVARVIPTPVVYPSSNVLYLTATPYLSINGINFNTKDTKLFFSPPLNVGHDISIAVKSPKKILVRLLAKATYKTRWAEEPGPLKVVAIDTGAGRMLLRGDLNGVTVGEIQADLSGHGVKVDSHEEVNMYQTKTKSLTISGEGFDPDNTLFRFTNGIRENVNYTSVITQDSATLTLMDGNKWKLYSAVLPSPLVLLAANAGAGWVPVGATLAKAGRRVATIFEDPSIEECSKEIRRTTTHELIVKGTGFVEKVTPRLVFDPSIDNDRYNLHVLNRTHVRISLASGSMGWLSQGEAASTNLYVTHVNTGAGMVTLDQRVRVAVVLADEDIHDSGIHVHPNYETKIYKSSTRSLIVDGQGFPEGVDAKLRFGRDFGPKEGSLNCERLSDTQLKLTMVDGQKWAAHDGELFVSMIIFGVLEVPFPDPGIKVATVLEDPVVNPSELHVYASHTKSIQIKGQGLATYYSSLVPKIVLSPTSPEYFQVSPRRPASDTIVLELVHTAGSSNDTPVWAVVIEEGDLVPMKVISIDTGAGPVEMPEGGVVVAHVRMDDGTYDCNDSCIYANDNQCDEDQDGSKFVGGWSRASSSNYESATTSESRPESRDMFVSSVDDWETQGASCEVGTDCTDCGKMVVTDGDCANTCMFANDDACDDRRGSGLCPDGTDCGDCGLWVNMANFTLRQNPYTFSSMDDDDKEFLADDSEHPILDGQRNNAHGRYYRVFKKHAVTRQESEGSEAVFLDILWSVIVLVGVAATGFIVLLAVRCAKGDKVELPIPTNPDVEGRR